MHLEDLITTILVAKDQTNDLSINEEREEVPEDLAIMALQSPPFWQPKRDMPLIRDASPMLSHSTSI